MATKRTKADRLQRQTEQLEKRVERHPDEIEKKPSMDTNATTDDDVNAIKKLGDEFFAGVNTGDLARRMSTMDADAIIMPPDRPSIIGSEEIRLLSKNYSATYEEKCNLVYDEVETAGNWGFARATVTGTRISRSGGGVEKVSFRNLWIVKRQTDGKWKFWRIMFNSAIPPQTS